MASAFKARRRALAGGKVAPSLPKVPPGKSLNRPAPPLRGPRGESGVGLPGPAGAPGPTGARGPAGSAVAESHVEAFGAAPTWVVNHNFGRHPNTWAIETPGGVEIEVAVQHVNLNQTIVMFDTQTAGIAKLT